MFTYFLKVHKRTDKIMPRLCKEHLQINNEKDNPIKNGQNTRTRVSYKKKVPMANTHVRGHSVSLVISRTQTIRVRSHVDAFHRQKRRRPTAPDSGKLWTVTYPSLGFFFLLFITFSFFFKFLLIRRFGTQIGSKLLGLTPTDPLARDLHS